MSGTPKGYVEGQGFGAGPNGGMRHSRCADCTVTVRTLYTVDRHARTVTLENGQRRQLLTDGEGRSYFDTMRGGECVRVYV